MASQTHTAPPDCQGHLALGRTLIDLLDTAVERYPNPTAFNRPTGDGEWVATSNADFREVVHEVAAGLREFGLSQGDHVAFLLHSDYDFVLFDLGTLLAGFVNVPLYTTFSRDNLIYVTTHAEAEAIVVADPEMLARFSEWAPEVPDVRLLILAAGEPGDVALPDGLRVVTAEQLRAAGRRSLAARPDLPAEMRAAIGPSDLATLIYTSGTTGQPKGVMLTHENVSFDGYAAVSAYEQLGHAAEHVLAFLPMTHIYARALSFASLALGHSVYFSDPDHLTEHLPQVRPTLFATVPRVLEKVFDRVMLGIEEAEGAKKKIGAWAMGRATRYDLAHPPAGLEAVKHKLADALVYSKLRERLGLTRIKVVSVGGAALRADLSTAFGAMSIPCFQGYGLTETSPVITAEIPGHREAGTVGPPIVGVEVAIADDGEILTRGPHVMQGYFKDTEGTAAAIDADGWFYTGDIGAFSAGGNLRITDRKKALFKLSTGKYVIPQPLENALQESPLVEQAVVVGLGQKYTSALLFPAVDAVRTWARNRGGPADLDDAALLRSPIVLSEFERVVASNNEGVDHWTQIKRFRLCAEPMSVENGLLTPKLSVKRSAVNERYAEEIEAMYATKAGEGTRGAAASPDQDGASARSKPRS
jgi:long-chain acyl-CoA synthetase